MKQTILVLDDDRSLRQSFVYYLEDEGYAVLSATNGQEALGLVEANRPDLALTDLRMPEMDGFEFMQHCTKILPEMPVIVISGANNAEDVVEALRLGAADYLVKPVDLKILGHRVSKGLERARLLRENRDYQGRLEELVDERTAELDLVAGQLEDNEEKQELLIENMADMVSSHRADSTITYVSPSCEELTGFTATELVGTRAADYVYPDDVPVTLTAIGEAVADRRDKYRVQHRLRRKDGHYVWVETIGKLSYDTGGELLEIQCNVRDITERKRLEDQLRQSQKMDAVGLLAGGVAHDFNNMLTGIIGAAEVAQAGGNLCEEDAGYIEMILNASLRAADLTGKLLAFSRKARLKVSPVGVHEIIGDTVALLERSIDKKVQICLHLDAAADVVVGDGSQLQSSLMNICINASHAMPDGGDIAITSRNLTLDAAHCEKSTFNLTPGDYIEIGIADTGTGIGSEHLNKIFEPFFTTKEQGKGTGLGLSAVYGIVESHHGEVTVCSEPGVGTAFYIRLPSSEAPVSEKSDMPQTTSGVGTILLIDDEDVARIAARRMLESIGYTVLEAANGEEGVQVFETEREQIDLVILDMIMPVMDGRETFTRIRKIDPGVKVVICSGYSVSADLADLIGHGLHGVIQKPFRIPEISRVVADALRER